MRHFILLTIVCLFVCLSPAAWAQDNVTTKSGTVSEVKVLEDVVVTASVPQMTVDGDTINYKADTYATTPDATVEDLLKLLPGLEVDEDGNIKAQGQEVKQIYVNGKEFFGNNQKLTTRNLTADMVEDVQVVEMQTEEARMTGVDDGERRKVINLKLKKNMDHGWFGNLNAGWGEGSGIDDRYDTRATIGQFYGNTQNALAANCDNLRNPGASPSWNIGLNINHDRSNRLRDWNTPFAIGGDVSTGGNGNDGYNKQHRINYLDNGSTVNDSESTTHSSSRNVKGGFKFEKSWGTLEEGMHRLQFNPTVSLNRSTNDNESENSSYQVDTDEVSTFISQTKSSTSNTQENAEYNVQLTYSYFKRTDNGRRRASITLSTGGTKSESDRYTWSDTHYADRDTLINQWQDENGSSRNYRVRLTYVEPLPNRQTLELSGSLNHSVRDSKQIYYFWDELAGSWSETIDGRSNTDYNSDTHTENLNFNFNTSWRMVNDKYNVRIGMDLLPQINRFTDYFDHNRDYRRTYINYSPRAEYTYMWSKHRQIRMTLNGRTQQPSANQLMARKNQTSATHVSLGNIDLDPAYSMNYEARFRNFNEETFHSIEASVRSSATFNNLATKRWYSPDLRTDTTMTVNMKGVGNWNASADFRGTFPFANNLWQATTYTQVSYNDAQGYANQKSSDQQINHSQTTELRQQAGIGYRHAKIQIDLNGNYSLQYTRATIMQNGNLGTTHNFGASLRLTAHLPYDFNLNSDFNYTGRRGFSAGMSKNQSIWNAQLSRTFLPKKNLSAYIKVYDLLQQRSSFNRSVSATSLTDSESRVLGEYFLIGATFRFNTHPGRRGGRGNRDFGGDRPGPDGPGGGGFGGGGFGGPGGGGRGFGGGRM